MPPKSKKRPAEAPVKPPTRKWLRRQQQPTSSNPADTSSLALPQLKALPAEVLRLYLSSRNLITTGNITAMASRLHSALHQQQSDLSPSASVTSQTAAPPLAQLQQSVRDMVDKSLQGLQGRLLDYIITQLLSLHQHNSSQLLTTLHLNHHPQPAAGLRHLHLSPHSCQLYCIIGYRSAAMALHHPSGQSPTIKLHHPGCQSPTFALYHHSFQSPASALCQHSCQSPTFASYYPSCQSLASALHHHSC